MDQQQQLRLRRMSMYFADKAEHPGDNPLYPTDDDIALVPKFQKMHTLATVRYLDQSGKHADNDLLFNADERSKAAAGINDEFTTLARLAEYVTVEELEAVSANANNL
ncbi:MAG: hypothetical protein KDK05_13805 [Candidatus Competibacteraceae bacterium]|nr:hypothetical protein [Candidatus Competibacteraceae bacterium]